MPPRKKSTGPVPVEQITHDDKRVNLPTADAQEFVRPDIEERRQTLVERDSSLDPQLVWKGKYGDESAEAIAESEELAADAPPLFIQEKIDPRVLIEDLRREQKKKPEHDDEHPTLFESFEDFDGLNELDLVDFYSHSANWSNRLVLGDSLQVMGSLAEREELRGQVQMIYIDPPYGIKFGSNWQVSTRKRDVKDGKAEDAAREAEQIKAFRDTWELGIHSYLSYLRDRLQVARELLTESGSCFVQIGDENVHLVRSLMDEVFGAENYIAIINYTKTSAQTAEHLPVTTDYIVWYSNDLSQVKYRRLFNLKSLGGELAGMYQFVEFEDGTSRRLTHDEVVGKTDLPGGSRPYRLGDVTSQRQGRDSGPGSAMCFPVTVDGRKFYPPGNRGWSTREEGMATLRDAGRLVPQGQRLSYKRYIDDFAAAQITNNWTDSAGATDRVYVVQTSTRIVERCMLMCTDPGDLVLDPTCGSGTTAFVAEQWGRRWITIDTSRVALALTRQRLMGGKFPMYHLKDSEEGRQLEAKASGQRVLTDSKPTNDIRHGFVYQRVPHITLKSIANNPDIQPGMSREEIDAAIKRHADVELLYDKPYENRKSVRVTGPFTVESLSPHRAVEFSGQESEELTSVSEYTTATERQAETQPDALDYDRSILDNLASAGIQNGIKNERLEFDSVEPYAGDHIQAIGNAKDGSTVGIVIGPQYGTVSQAQARDAVREALTTHRNPNTPDIDLLAVLGFSFDPTITEITNDDNLTVDAEAQGIATVAGERAFGKVRLLFVRMNTDLLMGTQLKKTGSGNLFTVFGEPDIAVKTTEEGVVVDLKGVDVYDPTTGEIRSNQPDQIALWMIDTDYNGDSFFVRHCYFTGGGDPYKRLKTALKADIDAEAWDTLYATTSRSFPKPETGKIAVKVINDYGDEVMKVYEV